LRVLYLSPRQSWPPVTGAKLRDYHLAKALGSQAELTYVFYSPAGQSPPTPQDLPFCRDIVAIPAPRPYSPWKLARGVLGSWPITVLNYTSPEMIRRLGELVARQAFDFVHVDIVHMAACEAAIRPQLGNTPVFYNWHNIESELMYRYGEQSADVLRRQYARITARRLETLESKILNTAAGHVVCSDREREILSRRNPQARIAVIENGVDLEAYGQVASSGPPEQLKLVFVGSMNYHANIEGAVWFTREVWPKIRARFPEAKLTLVGAEPAPAVLALRSEPGIAVTGTVPDIRPYYQGALAAIVPLKSGSGTRLKILEAMAAGVPVLSTRVGAEGLQITPGKDLLIAEQTEEWLAGLTRLQSAEQWGSLAASGRTFAARYGWISLGQKLWETYRQWMGLQ